VAFPHWTTAGSRACRPALRSRRVNCTGAGRERSLTGSRQASRQDTGRRLFSGLLFRSVPADYLHAIAEAAVFGSRRRAFQGKSVQITSAHLGHLVDERCRLPIEESGHEFRKSSSDAVGPQSVQDAVAVARARPFFARASHRLLQWYETEFIGFPIWARLYSLFGHAASS